jgi:glucuronate isomerase
VPDFFVHDDFLLPTATAKRLYHEVAAGCPIIDYHCHLPPAEIASNRRFANLTEVWLGGDHYKWRAMRSNGVSEDLITGDAPAREKFQAWAESVPMTYRNPLHHWTHLELARCFGIFDVLDGDTAESTWTRANARLAEPGFCVRSLLDQFRVEVVGTTDDPVDSLEFHVAIRAENLGTRVVPTFRPDRAMAVEDPPAWNDWVERLAERSETTIADFPDLLNALRARHDFFHDLGARSSDHGLSWCPCADATDAELGAIFRRVRSGDPVTGVDREKFATRILLETGRWNHARGWVMQLHLGAQRNNNSRMLAKLGRDTGFDSIGDWPQTESLAGFLDRLDRDNSLPRTILYNVNPKDNYPLASMLGNFQDGSIPGKIQFGSGWWFLDQLEGMTWQINALSQLGLLSRFVGMLTDSRSFLSFPRHEYFRRLLCRILGEDVENGLIPSAWEPLRRMVDGICHTNARDYFRFE